MTLRSRGRHVVLGMLVSALVLLLHLERCLGAEPALSRPAGLVNGGMEQPAVDGRPAGWIFPAALEQAGYRLTVETSNPQSGDRSASIDATASRPTDRPFGNLMQSLDAAPYRGRRVRFRAAVRTDELGADGQAQLWLRVDLAAAGGQNRIGAFDNMQDRPIRDGEWRHYEIVGQVADDATRINLGLLLIGTGRAWLDDASLEVVSEETPATAAELPTAGGFVEDPPQPFFVPWLALAVVALGLFGLSQLKPGPVQRFAFRFSFAYWLLYNLPAPFDALLPFVGSQLSRAYDAGVDGAVRWTAANVLGIERTLIAPNGSGDTTFNYVQLLVCFALALTIAAAWSVVDRRKSDYRCAQDLLRSYLRYVLAFIMLGYGLAKVGSLYNQFPTPEIDQLMKPYGESSPMNLVWTFMGSSRAYTFVSGAAEVLGALLLVWRRTATLGALVTAGVTLNIVLLNFCYDVPVKQFSAHLLAMAIYLTLADAPRLAGLLIWNRAVPPTDLRPPSAGQKSIWVRRIVKAAVLCWGMGVPLASVVYREVAGAAGAAAQPAYFGAYEVESFRRDGEEIPPVLTDSTRWRTVSLRRNPYFGGGGPTDAILVRAMDQTVVHAALTLSPDGRTLTQRETSALPGELTIVPLDEGRILLSGTIAGQPIEARLRRIRREDFLLVRRGFRWINEYPFNR